MKRPEEEEFWEAFEKYEGDTAAMAEEFECSRVSIYNWKHEFEDMKKERMLSRKSKALDISSDIEEDKEFPFSYFKKKQEESPNKPKIREATISIPESALIFFISDTHFGSIYSDLDMANDIKEACRNTDNVYAMFVGDLIDYEGAGPPDIKYDQAFAHPSTTRAMAEAYIREFDGKMLLMVTGCHDDWVYRHTGETFVERLKKYVPTNAVFKDSVDLFLKVGNIDYTAKIGHKVGKGHSSFNPSHGGFRLAREDKTVDLVVTAHRHKPGIATQFVRDIQTTVINCGTCKLLDDYSNKGFEQQPLAMPCAYFDKEKKRIIPFFNWRDGLDYVRSKHC